MKFLGRRHPYIRYLGLSIALLCSAAQATVIDFEDVAPTSVVDPCFQSASVGCTLSSLDSSGYRFTAPANGFSNHAHLVSSPWELPFVNDGLSFPSNGTQYIGLDTTEIVMKKIDGGAFSISRFDAAEGFMHGGILDFIARKLRIDGSIVGGGTVTSIVDFDGINDGTGPLADFETFTLPITFTNLSSITFRSLTASGVPGNVVFSVDNIAVTAVPEPTTSILMMAGLGMLFARRTILGTGV